MFYLDHGETANGPIEKVYVTTLVTPMGLASSFNGGIFKIIVKKWANFENSINHHKMVWYGVCNQSDIIYCVSHALNSVITEKSSKNTV